MINFLYTEKIKNISKNTIEAEQSRQSSRDENAALNFLTATNSAMKVKKSNLDSPASTEADQKLFHDAKSVAELETNYDPSALSSKKLGSVLDSPVAEQNEKHDLEQKARYDALKEKYQNLIQSHTQLHITTKRMKQQRTEMLVQLVLSSLARIIEINFTPRCIQQNAYYDKWPEFSEKEIHTKFKTVYLDTINELINLKPDEKKLLEPSAISKHLLDKLNENGLIALSAPSTITPISDYLHS